MLTHLNSVSFGHWEAFYMLEQMFNRFLRFGLSHFCRQPHLTCDFGVVWLRLPFHLDTILIPFACVSMGDGIFVLADVASVTCSSDDETFVAMFGAGGACGSFAIRQMLKFPT